MLLLLTSSPAPVTVNNLRPAQIPNALLGTGVKILVRVGTTIKQRATTEGIPQVLVNGVMRDLPAGDTLQS